MARRSLHRIIYWLLPLLAVRALIPVGFMLTLDAQGLHLVACPAQSAQLVAMLDSGAGHAFDAHAHHADSSTTGPHESHEEAAKLESPCAYALATFALAAAPYLASAAYEAFDPPLDVETLTLAGNGPARADRIRGPPHYS